VIERILAFSRSGVRPATLFAPQPVVEQVLGLLAATLPAGVRIERRLDAADARLRGDSTGLFEAVMNLCTNALQSMHGSGVLSVELQRTSFTAPHATSHGSVPTGTVLRLSVADTGDGIVPEVMARLFDPFFTTRGQQGTGLGLAVVHGVVEALGGAIDVSSRPGEGSRFTLFLPLATAADGAAAPEAVDDGTALPRGRGESVLLVDDEPALVELAEELLAALGYEPVGLTDPVRALAEVRADPQRFDLVITDEVMPGLAGTALAAQLHALRPALPVLLLSGYGGPQLARRAAEAGIRQVLAKPLQQDELARALAVNLRKPDSDV